MFYVLFHSALKKFFFDIICQRVLILSMKFSFQVSLLTCVITFLLYLQVWYLYTKKGYWIFNVQQNGMKKTFGEDRLLHCAEIETSVLKLNISKQPSFNSISAENLYSNGTILNQLNWSFLGSFWIFSVLN